MGKPIIKKENCVEMLDARFIRVYDLQYKEGKHYYDATRRDVNNLVAIKTDEEFKNMTADAVSCVVIINIKGQQPLLYLCNEYRYPTGQFLLSVPAGLIDKQDLGREDVLECTAIREIYEETGIKFDETTDTVRVVNPCLFSTPGLTDESNALVQVVINRDELPEMSFDHAEGSEMFEGKQLLTKEDAYRVIKNGRDDRGIFYSVYTWMGLVHFVTDMWK